MVKAKASEAPFARLARLQARAMQLDAAAATLRHHLKQPMPEHLRISVKASLTQAEKELAEIAAEVTATVTAAKKAHAKAQKAAKKGDKLADTFKQQSPQLLAQLQNTNPQAAAAVQELMAAHANGNKALGQAALQKAMSFIPAGKLGPIGNMLPVLGPLGLSLFAAGDDDDDDDATETPPQLRGST